ncbi:MAG TPA: hypothetical protein VFY93_15445 [Planctomycetota bacterium]|nr:hypothetical protein [Planctomycetota bacterium]
MRTALGILLLLVALAVGADEPNLLPNGDFKKGEDGWVLFQLGGADAREIDKDALHVAKAADSKDRPAMIWTDYALDPGQEGKLAFSIRAKGKKLGRTQIAFIVWDDAGNAVVEEKVLDDDLGAKWKTFERTIGIPGPSKGGRILVRLFEKGELWLADAGVRLVGVKAEPEPVPKGGLGLVNGGFDTSRQGWTTLSGSDDLELSVDRKQLRLSRGGHRLYPEQGVEQVVVPKGKVKSVVLTCRAHAEGATACVAILAESADGGLLGYARQEPSGDAKLPLDLPAGTKRLRVVLAIRGPGDAWFDDVRLE